MTQSRDVNRDTKVLSEPVATRLLSRASELDAALRAGASVAELRQAAVEAGISVPAFEAALAEYDAAQGQLPTVNVRRSPRWRMWMFAGMTALLIGVFAVTRMLVPASAAVPVVEEAFLLRCLSEGQAAELLRPVLSLPQNTLVYSSERAPGVLTVRATPAQLQEVRLVLDRYDGPGARMCGPAPARP